MAIIACPNPPNLCPDPDLAITNYSSEGPDPDLFIARNYGGSFGGVGFGVMLSGPNGQPAPFPQTKSASGM